MTAPHFFVEEPGAIEAGRPVSLSEEDSRHALRSLRLRPGEAVTLADDAGAWGTGAVIGEEDHRAVIDVQEVRQVARPAAAVSVALAPPKGDRLSWAVQKLGEVGVDELLLVPSDRTVREWKADRGERTAERLRAVAREAAMQSRRPFIMRILIASSFDEALDAAATVVLWEEAEEPLSVALPQDEAEVRLVIGPEGGFTDQEIAAARAAGARMASLGPGILRTETAAVVGATLALARRGRLG